MSDREALKRLWILMSIAFIDMVGALMIIPLLPFYAKRMGGDAITVGLLVSCFSAAQLVTSASRRPQQPPADTRLKTFNLLEVAHQAPPTHA